MSDVNNDSIGVDVEWGKLDSFIRDIDRDGEVPTYEGKSVPGLFDMYHERFLSDFSIDNYHRE